MEYIKELSDYKINSATVMTLGKFDGLHRGHELLMENLLNIAAQKQYKKAVFTFDVPPNDVAIHPVITTNEERAELFCSYGIDYLLECPFTETIKNMSPVDFISWMVHSFGVKEFVVGSDFCFGAKRSGNYETLIAYEKEFGYHTNVFDKVQEDGIDISSTYIRQILGEGDIPKANHLLGYAYSMSDTVVHGNQIGRSMGIPTINIVPPKDKLLPPKGVYVTEVCVKEQSYSGVTNVGVKPTVGEDNPIVVETFILDFCQEIYGEAITVKFLKYIRPERKFESLEALKEQIASDISYAKSFLNQG